MTVASDDLLLFVLASPQREDMKIVQLRLWLGSGPSVGARGSDLRGGEQSSKKGPEALEFRRLPGFLCSVHI